MPPFQVIEFVDPTGQEIVHRKPESGSGEFRLGDQLVVQESQKAVIFRDGKALDVFEPGRHTLATANLPLLSNLLGAVFGKSPFRVSVVFVAMKAFLNQGWGTPQPIALRDSEFGMVRLRGFGTYAFRVNDVSLFVNKVVGSQGLYTTNDVVDYLKSILLNAIAPAIANLKLSILDVPSNYAKIRAGVLALARDQFNDYGVELLDFNIESITPTDETAKAIDERAAMGAIGDMRAYLQFKAARALGDAAAKEAAPGADLTGAGLGLGAGIGLGGALAGAVSQAMQAGAGTGPAAPDIMTVEEAARYLRVSVDDVLAAIESGDLKAKKVGTQYRISKGAVDEFLKK